MHRRKIGFLGFYPRSGFMHIDLGPALQCGDRYSVRAATFAATPVNTILRLVP